MILSNKDSLQQQIHFNGNIFGHYENTPIQI